MSAVKKSEDTKPITLTYDLFELQSSQHKAGLAGLILLRDSLHEREINSLPKIEPNGSTVTVSLPEGSLGVLMRDMYAAFSIKTPKKKKSKKKGTQEADSNGGDSEEKERVFPRLTAIERLLSGGENSLWLKLWREMVVGTIKIRPTAQAVYKKDESLKKIIDDALSALPVDPSAQSEEIASSVYLGAESSNAELVGFKNRADHKFLLHFWPLSSMVYVPRFLVREERNGEKEWKESFEISKKRRGPFFVIVVPDITNIIEFTAAMKEYIQRLDDDVIGYRPAGAVVDLPEEAAVDFVFRMMRRRVGQEDLSAYVSSVQVFYVETVGGKSAKILSETTITPNRRMLAEYEELQDRRLNPHYKSLRIRNVLADNRWHHGADAYFSYYPFEHFVWTAKTPSFHFFGSNVKRYFEQRIIKKLKLLKENNAMNEADPAIRDDVLARRIYRLIGEYVKHKTENRSQMKDEDLKRDANGHRIYPEEFREAREKVTSDAFLAMRSRRAEDFVEYFTGTICSVPHFVQESEYIDLTQALIQKPDTVKNLSMLALSAYSYLPGKETNSSTENQDQGETK